MTETTVPCRITFLGGSPARPFHGPLPATIRLFEHSAPLSDREGAPVAEFWGGVVSLATSLEEIDGARRAAGITPAESWDVAGVRVGLEDGRRGVASRLVAEFRREHHPTVNEDGEVEESSIPPTCSAEIALAGRTALRAG